MEGHETQKGGKDGWNVFLVHPGAGRQNSSDEDGNPFASAINNNPFKCTHTQRDRGIHTIFADRILWLKPPDCRLMLNKVWRHGMERETRERRDRGYH